MITSYEFYTSKYFGDIIPDNCFERYEGKAVDDLHELTFNRLKEQESFSDEVQKAVCALAELNYQIEIATKVTMVKENGSGGVIKSKSSGGESVSYDMGNNLIYTVLNDNKAQEKLKYDTVKRYLRGTGLLYAGVE